MSLDWNEAVDMERGQNALDDESHHEAGRVKPHCHIVRDTSVVTAENEEALIEWLIEQHVFARCD